VSNFAHGIAPKMKPISRRRSAIVCALDIGTSKIVCAIARLKPRPPQDVLPRRTHAIEVLGIGHTQAQGMKSGTVVDIAAAEEMLRHAVDQAERAAGVHVDSVVLPLTAGRTASEQFAATVVSFANPDFVDVVVHSYRHRYGLVAGDPAYEATEERIAAQPAITVPTVVLDAEHDGLGPPGRRAPGEHEKYFTQLVDHRFVDAGHDLPQENPTAFLEAVLLLDAR